MAKTYLSREGYDKLRKQLDVLKAEKRQTSKDIGEAMEQGDLRENAGYTAAKERQAELLRRIGEIEEKLSGAQLIEELGVSTDEVRIGAKVTLGDGEDKLVYTLVGPEESDPMKGKLSVHSPLAQGMLGAKAGQTVEIKLPAGAKKFKVLKVEYGT
jgi:transcription elongation factor GreA